METAHELWICKPTTSLHNAPSLQASPSRTPGSSRSRFANELCSIEQYWAKASTTNNRLTVLLLLLLAASFANAQPTLLQLSPTDPDTNTNTIHNALQQTGAVKIPPGIWPVRPISLDSGHQISGSLDAKKKRLSTLKLVIDPPGRYDDQHVLATAIQPIKFEFAMDIGISDLIIDGNFKSIDWKNAYADGNAFGIFLRGAARCNVSNVEIKNCWTDGIYISTVLGHANNTRDSKLDRVSIHDCGRQGVSIVGGENLELTNFKVRAIGRNTKIPKFAKSPRAAIDLEPEANVQRLVRNITISDWNIARTGQGVLISGGHSAAPAEKIIVRNIQMKNMDGPQILSARDVQQVAISNIVARNHRPKKGGLGIIFRNATGKASQIDLRQLAGSNFPLRVDGASNIQLEHVHIEGCERGVMQIGGEPGKPQERTKVSIRDFLFTNVGQMQSGLPVLRVNSAEEVAFFSGKIENIGQTPFTSHLFTDAHFQDCEFSPGVHGTMDPAKPGRGTGETNNW